MASNIVFDILARDKASTVFRGVGDEAGKTSSKMEKFHKVGAAAGVALAGGLALAGVAAVKATKAAALDQQAQANLARTLHAAAGASKAQVASTEAWITAQGKAKGVADDELRPALSKLAVATGDVGKAQKLASLAMDISTGTGKSLTSVAFALAKAQGGNVSGLARLGVQTTKTTGDTLALEKAQTAAKQAQLTYTAAVKAHGQHSAEAGIALDKLKQANQSVGLAQDKTKKTTLSLDQITKNLAATYGGAAAKNATTAAGKQKILTVQMSELQEQIGAKLLPVMLKLSSVGLSMVNWISKNTTTVAILVGVFGGFLATLYAVSAAIKLATLAEAALGIATAETTGMTLVQRVALVATTAAQKAAAVASKAWAAAQWLINVALTANPIGLVVVAIAALVAGLVIAYKKSETFRTIVQGAFHGVQAVAAKVFGWLKDAVSATIGFIKGHWQLLLGILGGPVILAAVLVVRNWGKIKAAFSNAISDVLGFVRSHWGLLVSIIGGPLGAVVVQVIKHWGQIKAATSAAIGSVVGFFRALPGKIIGAIGNLGNLLFNAGQQVVQGLINGIQSMAGGLLSKASSLAHSVSNSFKGALGIHSPSKVFRDHGRAIMDGLVKGIADRRLSLEDALTKVIDLIGKVKDKNDDLIANAKTKVSNLTSTRAGFAGTFTADNVFGTDLSEGGGIEALITARDASAKQAKQLLADVKRAGRLGLSKALIRQLQSQGTSGAAALHAIATGPRDRVALLNRLDKQTSASLRAAGLRAGNEVRGGNIGDDIRRARRQEHDVERRAAKQERVLDHLADSLRDLAQTMKKDQTISVVIGDEAIIRAIRRRNTRKGVKSADL